MIRKVPFISGVASLCIGVLVTFGWIFELGILKSVVPGFVSMKANTAVAFGLSGLLLLHLSRRLTPQPALVLFSGGVITLVGLLTLAQYILPYSFSIDEILFVDSSSVQTSHPGRMSPATAFNFILLGLAFILADRGRTAILWSQILTIIAAGVALFSIVGYVLEYQSFYRVAGFTSIALHTAITFLILSFGVLHLRPYDGLMIHVTTGLSGGKLVRQWLPLGVGFVILLGALIRYAEKMQVVLPDAVLPFVITAICVFLSVLAWIIARTFNAADQRIKNANRLYAMLSHVNQRIIRIGNTTDLYNDVCRIAVTFGNFRAAWVGILIDDVAGMEISGRASSDPDFFERKNSGPSSLEVFGHSIRKGENIICNDTANSSATFPFCHRDGRSQCRGFASFPLKQSANVIGAFSVYANEPDFFTEEEIRLLEEIASDISFGLETLVREAERKRGEAALREKTDELDRYFTMTLDLLCIADTDGNFHRLNKEWESTLGYKIEELEGRPFLHLVHPDDLQPTMASLSRLGEGKEVLNFVNRYRRKDGEYRWIEWRSFPAGNLIYASARDITDRKEAVEALAESEERFRRTFEQAAVGIAHVGLDGRWLYVNQKICDIVGYTREELLTKTFQDITHPDDLDTDLDNVRRVLDNEILTYSMEKRYIRKDEQIVWINLTVSLVRHNDGKPKHFISVVEDISLRKQTEQQLAESQSLLQDIIDNTPALIYALDAEGRFVLANRALESLMSVRRGQLAGRVRSDVMPETVAEEHRANDLRVIQAKKPLMFEELNDEPDGKHYYYTVKFPLMREDGRVSAVCGISTDITEQRRSEKAIRELAAQYQSMVTTTSDGFWLVSMDGRFLDVNDAYCAMSGYTREELLGRTVADVEAAEKPDDIARHIRKITQSGSDRFESKHRTKDGRVFNVEVSASYQREEGRFITFVRDISLRKRMEEELRESEERYRHLFEASPMPMWLFDLETLRFIAVNDTAVSHYGYTRDEFLRMTIKDVRPQEDISKLLEDIADVRRGISTQGVWTHRKKDGSLIDVEITAHDFVTDGRPARLVLANDVTERRRAQEALRESEDRFRQVANTLPQLVWTCQGDGPCDYLGEQWVKYTGIPEEQQLGYGWLDQLHPDDRELTINRWNAAVESGTDFRVEFRIRRHDGVYRWFDTQAVRLRDADGRTVKWFGSNTDITERKQTEEALHRYTERLAVINRIDQVIASSLDLEKVFAPFVTEMGHLLPFDQSSLVLFDETKQRAKAIQRWVNGRAATPVQEWVPIAGTLLETILAHPKPFLERVRGTAIDRLESDLFKREGICSRIVAPLLIEAEVIGVMTVASSTPDAYSEVDLGLVQSLAHQMALAVNNSRLYQQVKTYATGMEQLVNKRTAELLAANKELDAFAYSVSHDLRAPLRAVDGFTRLLQEEYSESLDSEGMRITSVVRENTQRMGQLIDDLLALSRLGQADMQTTRIDMKSLAQTVYKEFTDGEKCGRILLEIGNLPDAQGDPGMMRQVWANLISNAIKFSSRRQQPAITITCTRNELENIYCVRDNGVGFNMKYAKKLFGVFQRLHSTKDFEGTGVGLAIVQRVIHRHGGKVWAEAEIDKGASLYFSLPRTS